MSCVQVIVHACEMVRLVRQSGINSYQIINELLTSMLTRDAMQQILEEKTVLNDYATTTKTDHNNSFLVVFQSLWTVLVVVA
jgi:hypothetical protein